MAWNFINQAMIGSIKVHFVVLMIIIVQINHPITDNFDVTTVTVIELDVIRTIRIYTMKRTAFCVCIKNIATRNVHAS